MRFRIVRGIGIEGDGKVVEDDVVLRQGEGVHHRAPADRDRHLPPEPTVRSDHRVLHGASPAEVVRDGVQFAGTRIDEGVPGVPTADRTLEVTHIDGFQLRRQLGRRRTPFDERK